MYTNKKVYIFYSCFRYETSSFPYSINGLVLEISYLLSAYHIRYNPKLIKIEYWIYETMIIYIKYNHDINHD